MSSAEASAEAVAAVSAGAAVVSPRRGGPDKHGGQASPVDETEEVAQDALAQLRARMAEQRVELQDGTAIPYPAEDDVFLLAFLRARKFNVDKAFLVLQNYTKFMHENEALLEGVTVESLRHVYDMGFMAVLNATDRRGRYAVAAVASRAVPH